MIEDKNTFNNKRALTITEAAEYTGISEAAVRNWIVSGLIPYEELPGRGNGYHKFRLIRKTDLDDFLEKHYRPSKRFKKQDNSNELVLLPKDLR